jgi:ribonuclease HI
VYADGACSGNPGPGAFGFLMYDPKDPANAVESVTPVEEQTTNNRMELMAVIDALEKSPVGATVFIYLDSDYVRKNYVDYLPGWITNNWLKTNNKPVKNRELWERLHVLVQERTIIWEHVEGHGDNDLHNKVDELVRTAAKVVRS